MKKFKHFLKFLPVALVACREWLVRPRGAIALANELAGRDPSGVTTLFVDSAQTVPVTNAYIGGGKYLIYQIGTNSTALQRTGMVCAGGATKAVFPLGISPDAPYQAGDQFAVRLFGATTGTEVGISAGAVSDQDWVYSAANGLVASAAQLGANIREEFALVPRPKVTLQNPGIPRRMGLGDAIGRPASWIGQKMKLDCMERDATGNATRILKPDSPCAARKARLNAIGEKVTTTVKKNNHLIWP